MHKLKLESSSDKEIVTKLLHHLQKWLYSSYLCYSADPQARKEEKLLLSL